MHAIKFSPVVFLLLMAAETFGDTDYVKQKRILLNDNYYTIVSKLDTLEKEFEAFKANNGFQTQKPIAFMAELTTSVSGQNHHIYYDNVKLNLGNAYNPHHGMFVAPVNGTYLFAITACSSPDKHSIVLQVNVNNAVLGKHVVGDSSWSICSSKVFLTQLSVGDDVFVQHLNLGDFLLALDALGLPTFLGVLLQAM